MTTPTSGKDELRESVLDLVSELIDPGQYEAEGIPDSEYERVADAIMQLIATSNQQAVQKALTSLYTKLPEWGDKAYYTKYPVLWKPIAPEGNAEHYDTGFNQAIELVKSLIALASTQPHKDERSAA